MTDDQQQPSPPPRCPPFDPTQLHVEAACPQVILGARVHYRGKQGRQTVRVADVICTLRYLDPDGVKAGDVPGLSSPVNVHLFVMTPSQRGFFTEYDIPFDESLRPGSWCWVEGSAPPGWIKEYRAWVPQWRAALYAWVVDQYGVNPKVLQGLYDLEFGAPDGGALRPFGGGVDLATMAREIGMSEDDTREAVDRLITLGLVERIPDDDPGTHLHNDAADRPPVPPVNDMVSVLGTLSGNHLHVLVAIADGDPGPGMSLAEVAAQTGLSDDQLDRIISDLVEHDLIDPRSWSPAPVILPAIGGAPPVDGCCGGASAPSPAVRCRCIDPSKHQHDHPSGEIDDAPPVPPASGDDEVVGSVPVGGGPEPAPADGGLSSP